MTIGWLNAIRRGQAAPRPGYGVPSLVLPSNKTHFAGSYTEASDRADTILDVNQIARWAGCFGGQITVTPIPNGRHDIFPSLPRRASARLRRTTPAGLKQTDALDESDRTSIDLKRAVQVSLAATTSSPTHPPLLNTPPAEFRLSGAR